MFITYRWYTDRTTVTVYYAPPSGEIGKRDGLERVVVLWEIKPHAEGW